MKISLSFVGLMVMILVVGLIPSGASAQTATSTATTTATTTATSTATTTPENEDSDSSTLAKLLAQLESLRAQIQTIRERMTSGEAQGNIVSNLAKIKIERNLKLGSSGEDVRQLQKLL